VNALDIAVQSQHVPITWHLLEMGVDPHRAGHYPLCIAATRGSELIVQLLLKKGVDPNAEVMPRRQDRPLHYAVRAGHEPVVRLLLEQGADPDAVSASAQTPLYMAAENGRVEIVDLLLEWGADRSRVAYQGTPLDVARAAWRQVEDKTRHDAVIRMLGG
jgi:cytochrome c